MFPWLELFQLMIAGVVSVYVTPMFWVVVALITYQYWQLQKSQRLMFGIGTFSLAQQVKITIVVGSIGGIIGSFLLTMMGVNINQLGFGYIWPVAILLMAINMRYLCFAYAGGLVALSTALFGWPLVDVPQVLVLVAILHITESILIAISGHCGSMPVILRRDNGQLVGAFNLQNFWPLPLILMSTIAMPNTDISSGLLNMPDWWPLLPVAEIAPEGNQWMYVMIPVVAALGYTDFAITNTPQMRRHKSALYLAVYSIILFALALLSVQYKWLQAIAALVSPLGHELLIQLDIGRELEGPPRYVPPLHGVMLLDTVIRSPANKARLKTGDILLKLHGLSVDRPSQLAVALEAAPPEFVLEFMRNGRMMQRKIKMAKEEPIFGVILVPNGNEQQYIELAQDKLWLWDWIKGMMDKNKR